MSASLLLGVALTFASTDGSELQMTVTLTESATASLTWEGETLSSTATTRHNFGPLPAPAKNDAIYMLAIGQEAPRSGRVPALHRGPLSFAVYGDSRDGDGPHRVIAEKIGAAKPDLIVHTGDVVSHAGDDEGWRQHLEATLSLSKDRPLLLALGNHEVFPVPGAGSQAGLTQTLKYMPPPDVQSGSPAAFHVRVGPALFIALDSNVAMGRGSPQGEYLERVLRAKKDARFVFVVMHHGPLSSGPHGPNDASVDLIATFREHGVTAVFSGHDHVYERIVQNGITYVVSGGGGAPLYPEMPRAEGSAAFHSRYNWVLVRLNGDRAWMEAYALEGALLDRAELAPKASFRQVPQPRLARVLLAAAMILGAIAWVLVRLVRKR